jgi:dethiobiotin synthetase
LTVVVVTGTGTEVGKTWVAAALLRHAVHSGLSVAARKPLQSFASPDAQTDASLLAAASLEHAAEVCAPDRSYPIALAPPMAAAALGLEVPTLAQLLAVLSLGDVDLAVVEGAGGVASPLAADGTTADLARALPADRVVLVADPSLGAINAVRLSVYHLAQLPVVVHLNRFDAADEVHAANRFWLASRDGFRVTVSVEELFQAISLDGP